MFGQATLNVGAGFFHLFAGIVIGFVLASQLRILRYQWNASSMCSLDDTQDNNIDRQQHFAAFENVINQLKQQKTSSGLLLIGVMTAQKYLDSRASSIYQTWARKVPGSVIFFSSFNSRSESGFPLVPLPTVDDSYPPQKKSFLMLKFMHDHFIDDYEFFMRADDDVYVETEKLEKFLKGINSSKLQFIGQAGLGNKEEFGQLNLETDENFCMGGPGIIMSRNTLKSLANNIQLCLKNLYSTHEDVEVGRCVRKFAGIPCTWSYEMQKLFHHNSSLDAEISSGHFNSKELHQAITIHPVKTPENMKRLHQHMNVKRHKDKRHKLELIQRKIADAKRLLNLNVEEEFKTSSETLHFHTGDTRNSVVLWEFISKHFYSPFNVNPKRHIESHIRQALDENIPEVMAIINKSAKQKGRIMEFKSLYYGYMRVHPFEGVDYILDLLMVYRKYRGRKITIPVRRHAYAIQTFSKLQIREVDYLNQPETVNIIVPLSGRIVAFKRFIENFIEVRSTDKFVSLSVVLFPDAAQSLEELNQTKSILKQLEQESLPIQVAQLGGFFSRAAALQRGATFFPRSALLLFLDVDMHFTNQVINRVRYNTIEGTQVYFPIVFSQYNPQFKQFKESPNFTVSDSEGYWRQFGFGIVAIYNGDFQSVGGLNVSIQGWGMEDVNMFDKIISSKLLVKRSVDPELIHIYHDITCQPSLTSTQYEMCIGTKLTSLGSVESLSRYININKYLRL